MELFGYQNFRFGYAFKIGSETFEKNYGERIIE